MGPPHLPRSVSRQKEWWPRSSRARHTGAIDAKRWRRTSRRTATPQEKLGKAQRCRCGRVPAAASLASSRDVGYVRCLFAREQAEHETSSPVKRIPFCFAVAFSTLAWAWARETCKWLMSSSLPCFSGPGVRAATARGVPILHAGLEGVFPTN